jgi:hypothetical protein
MTPLLSLADSTCLPVADADSDFYLMRIRIRLFTLMRIRIQILVSEYRLKPIKKC